MCASARGADHGARVGDQAGPFQFIEGRPAGPVFVHVDVQHVGAGPAGGDRDVGRGVGAPPGLYPAVAGGRVEEPVPGEGKLGVRGAREHVPPGFGVPVGGLFGVVHHNP